MIKFNILLSIALMGLLSTTAFAQDGAGEVSEADRVLKERGIKFIGDITPQLQELGLAVAVLPLQLRTAYAVGGVNGCETVISVSNFSSIPHEIEVEFFTGFNFLQRGEASLTLDSGETGEIATTDIVPPFLINAFRDDATPFEGYANIHARSIDIAAHAHMVCDVGGRETYQDINVFRVERGKPRQIGD